MRRVPRGHLSHIFAAQTPRRPLLPQELHAAADQCLRYVRGPPPVLLPLNTDSYFPSHAARYFELYHPSGCIEIAHTSRYSLYTGKSELCILATRDLAPGAVISELKGSMANLTEDEDRALKETQINSAIRRDFSVIHSRQMKKNHLFLGPARFVNVSSFSSQALPSLMVSFSARLRPQLRAFS